MDDSDTIKTIAIFTLLIAALLTGIPAYFLTNKYQHSASASYANCYAGGIILAVGLIHLLPEGSELLEEEVDSVESFGAMMAAVGYALILFLEKALLKPHTHVMPVQENHGEIRTEHEKEQTKEKTKEQTFSAVSLATALTVHSIIEGVVIGLMHEEDEALELFLAVLFHKLPAGLALGVNLRQKSTKVASIVLMIFALATPIGIVLGMIFEHLEEPVLEGILLAICAGTFLYIACNEVVAEEFYHANKGGLKFGLFFMGIVTYAVINQFTHSDGHDH